MSIVSALFDNRIYNFEQAFGVKDTTTAAMKAAIDDWFGLYYQTESTKEEDPCQRLPVTIVSKLSKTVFSEYSADSDNEFARMILDELNRARKAAVQSAMIGGECFLKPIIVNGTFRFRTIERRNYVVLGRDEMDNITDIGTAERTQNGRDVFTLLERRTVDHNGYLRIQNRLYQSTDGQMLGVEVPLNTLGKYAQLVPEVVYVQPVFSTGLIPVKIPLENCVDGSPDGASVYAPAAGLIHLINVNEAQLNGEFARGESRIIVSGDLMTRDRDGKRRLEDHVFTALDDDPDSIGVTIFSPSLREASFLARKTEYLRNIENIIGMKRGILSEVEAAERTATEITSSAGDYNLTIKDLQEMWENAAREAVRVCCVLGKLYGLYYGAEIAPDDISVSWGNGILYDEDKTGAEMLSQVQAGLLAPERYLSWYYDLPCETPAERAKIRKDYMPDMADEAEEDEI